MLGVRRTVAQGEQDSLSEACPQASPDVNPGKASRGGVQTDHEAEEVRRVWGAGESTRRSRQSLAQRTGRAKADIVARATGRRAMRRHHLVVAAFSTSRATARLPGAALANQPPLLEAKLLPPPLGSHLIRRSDLLLLVETTFLSQCAAAEKQPVACLSLDETDNDLRFAAGTRRGPRSVPGTRLAGLPVVVGSGVRPVHPRAAIPGQQPVTRPGMRADPGRRPANHLAAGRRRPDIPV